MDAHIPIAVSCRTTFTSDEISRFEKILTDPQSTEHIVSHFFQECPKFLWFNGEGEIRREVLLQTTGDKLSRVDFFKRTYGKRYWDIIELKSPNKPLLSGLSSSHVHLSALANAAISQAQDYRDSIIQDPSIRDRLERNGILVWRPQLLVVVGQEPKQMQKEIIATLFDRVKQSGVTASSYTDILNFAKEHYQRDKIIILPTPKLIVPQGDPYSQRVHVLLESIRESLPFDGVVLLLADDKGFYETDHVGRVEPEVTFSDSWDRSDIGYAFQSGRELVLNQGDYLRRQRRRERSSDYLLAAFPIQNRGIVIGTSRNWKILPDEKYRPIRDFVRLLGDVLRIEEELQNISQKLGRI